MNAVCLLCLALGCRWRCVVSDTYRCLRGGVDLASPSIKRNLNISKDVRYGDYAVGLFQNIINATS